MSPYAVIFDFDGTLIDSNEEHIDAWHQAFRSHGRDVPRDRIRSEIGKGGDQLVPAILGDDVSDKLTERLSKSHDDIFRGMARDRRLFLFEGALDLLDTLQRRWMTTALATSSKTAMLEEMQRSTGMNMLGRFDLVVTADHAARSKPAPDLIVAALWKLALPADRCIFIGDTVHDAEAASRAGVPFIGVTCGRCASESELVLAGAISVWRDPTDLLDHLDQVLAIGSLLTPS
jgi:HAD superfamily hydrolase (TIGR01509 family)